MDHPAVRKEACAAKLQALLDCGRANGVTFVSFQGRPTAFALPNAPITLPPAMPNNVPPMSEEIRTTADTVNKAIGLLKKHAEKCTDIPPADGIGDGPIPMFGNLGIRQLRARQRLEREQAKKAQE